MILVDKGKFVVVVFTEIVQQIIMEELIELENYHFFKPLKTNLDEDQQRMKLRAKSVIGNIVMEGSVCHHLYWYLF